MSEIAPSGGLPAGHGGSLSPPERVRDAASALAAETAARQPALSEAAPREAVATPPPQTVAADRHDHADGRSKRLDIVV